MCSHVPPTWNDGLSCSLTWIIRHLRVLHLVARLLATISQIGLDVECRCWRRRSRLCSASSGLPPSWRAKAGSGPGADPGERLAHSLAM